MHRLEVFVQDALELLPAGCYDVRPHMPHLGVPIEMCFLMCSQIAGLSESLVTIRVITHVWFFTCVSTQMCS